jgi:hypothetical protein
MKVACMIGAICVVRLIILVAVHVLVALPSDPDRASATAASSSVAAVAEWQLEFERFLDASPMPDLAFAQKLSEPPMGAFCRAVALPVCTRGVMYPEAKAFMCRRVVEVCEARRDRGAARNHSLEYQ